MRKRSAIMLAAGIGALAILALIVFALRGESDAAYRLTTELLGFPLEEPVAKPRPGPARYVGYGRCVFCHAANYYVVRLTTSHPDAYNALVQKKAQGNKECLPCHTVGYDQSINDGGYDDKGVDRRLLEGVQCESCHGKGSNHVKGLARLKKTYSAEGCRCHNGVRYPTLDEWKSSRHAKTLEIMWESGRAEDRCLKCMSADAISDGNVVLKNAKNEVTCVSCHNPHLNKYQNGLRKPMEELCVSCHTVGETGGHPQKEMVLGKRIIPGVEVTVHNHSTAIGTKCVTCHYYTRPYESDAEPAVTGHTFKANLELCKNCHADAEERWTNTQAEARAAINGLKARIDAIDGAKLPQDKKVLFDEVQKIHKALVRDGSLGIHNRPHAKALVKAAEDRLNVIAGQK